MNEALSNAIDRYVAEEVTHYAAEILGEYLARPYIRKLEAVAEAVRVERALMRALPDHIIQELWGLGLPESAMTHVSSTLDALDKEEE